MDMQNVKNLEIPEGEVKTIHDKDSRLLWGAVGYDTKYAGDTFQQTYTGKNLFDISKVITNFSTSGVKNNGDGTLTVTTPAGSSSVAALSPNKLSDYCPNLQAGDNAVLSMVSTGSNKFIYLYGTGANLSWNNGQLISVTQAMLDAMVLWYSSGVSSTATISNIQIEKNSTPTSYEPFVGGTASPNPQFPQDIQVVTGEQTITISDGMNSEDYKVYLTSKNLFDTYGDVSYSYGSTVGTVTNNMDGTITTTANGSSNRGKGQLIKNVIPGQKYTLGVTFYSTTSTLAIKGYIQILAENTTTEVGRISFNESSSGIPGVRTNLTLTIPNNVTGVWISFMSNGPSSETTYSDIQFELGETSTSYQPYYNYELAKIGTYQDYIYKSGDDWYVHKAINKATLNGSENYFRNNYVTGDTVYGFNQSTAFPDSVLANEGVLGFLCGSFITKQRPQWTSDIEGVTQMNDRTFLFTILRSRMSGSTATDWKTWLSSNNVTLYYALATPTDTKITDSALIGQLNAIHEWLTRYGYSATVTGNLPIIIDQTPLV